MGAEIKWDLIQESLGFSDAEIEEMKRSPKKVKLFKAGRRILKTRIIAEVVHSTGCNAQLQVGDRYVFNGVGILVPEASTGRVCIEAMGPLATLRRVMHDRIVEGLDPNDLVFDTVRCADPSLKYGGMGEVVFQVRAEVPE
jgi:hypothetical protein